MTALAGPWTVVCGLLLLGGALKAARPADTARALRALDVPGPERLIRLGGLAEVAIAAAALATGARSFALLVAASYVGFLVFVIAALRSDTPLSSCGCFGRIDTPPTWIHVCLNVVAAGIAVAAAITPPPGLASLAAEQPGWGIPFVFVAAVGVYLVFVMLTALPRLFAAPRGAD
jgi:hypothetical protein